MQDVDQMPYSLWGRVRRSVGGFNLSAKVDCKSSNPNLLGLNLQAAAPSGTVVQLTGSTDTEKGTFSAGNVKVTQSVDTGMGKFVITPTYSVKGKTGDVKLSYGVADTVLTIDANLDKQKITVSQMIGDNNLVEPSFSTDGDVEFEYRRSIGQGALTAAYKPDAYVGVSYEDGPWVATFRAPISGLYKPTDGVKVNIRRAVDVTGI
jgi:hypothetical protein